MPPLNPVRSRTIPSLMGENGRSGATGGAEGGARSSRGWSGHPNGLEVYSRDENRVPNGLEGHSWDKNRVPTAWDGGWRPKEVFFSRAVGTVTRGWRTHGDGRGLEKHARLAAPWLTSRPHLPCLILPHPLLRCCRTFWSSGR